LYLGAVKYVNSFGDGQSTSCPEYITLTSVPDAPTLISASDGDQQSVLVWSAPAFDGQTSITGYKIYRNNTLLTTLSSSALTYTATGLVNGFSYDFQVLAVNSVGNSLASSVLTANPYGQMSIVSVVASGKTLTATINPNGRPVTDVLFFAHDEDPVTGEKGSFIAEIPQSSISQSLSSNVTVIKTFNGFSSNIAGYMTIAVNSVGTDFQTNLAV